MTTTCDSSENSFFLTNDSLEYLSITTNGSTNEEETAENLLGVLPYQFEPEFNSDDAENHVTIEIVNENEHVETLLINIDSW